MGSQVDLDQGGTSRAWVKVYLGPSVGWVDAPGGNVFAITVPGTYNLDPSSSLIEVNVAGAVTIVLPSAIVPVVPAVGQPRLFVGNPVTIVDIGGNAQAHPITILPFSVAETIMGLTQIQIAVNFGAFSLLPNSAQKTWNNISP